MSHREKVWHLIADLGRRGVGSHTVAPPFYRLLWLLGGEYVSVPGISPGRSLDKILADLKAVTGISALEGFEWANLQKFNLANPQGGFIQLTWAQINQSFSGFWQLQ